MSDRRELDAWLDEALQRERERQCAMHINPDGGDYYFPHAMLVHSGQFWRCAHGLADGGCWRCALRSPLLWLQWHDRLDCWPTVDEGEDYIGATIAGARRIRFRGLVRVYHEPVLWLRLPSFGMYYDLTTDSHRFGQRVLVYHGREGWRVLWRTVESI